MTGRMIRSLSRLLTLPDKLALVGLVRGMIGHTQLLCASALLRSGAMAQLDRWHTVEEIAAATGAQERELLASLLDLGVRRRLLRKRGELYAARSAFAVSRSRC